MSPRAHRLALGVYLVAGSLVTLLLLLHAIPLVLDAWKQYPYDGKVDWIAARAFWDGRNPYSPEELRRVHVDGLGHPPTTSFWWLPFAGYPLLGIGPVVGLVILFAMLTMYFMLADELDWPLPPLSALLLFALVLSTSWMIYHLSIVQVSAFVAFLYFLAWYALRRGHTVAAGILFGCACTFKLFPGLMVLMLLVARRWRAVGAAVATYLVVAAIMTARFGLVSWRQYLSTEKLITDYWIGNIHNASIFGVTLRVLVPSCVATIKSQPACTVASIALAGALGYIAWGICKKALAEGRFDLPFVLFATLSVFANPFTFEHYFALLVFPIALTATAAVQAARLGMPRRELFLITALIVTVMMLVGVVDHRWTDPMPWTQHRLKHALELANWVHMPMLFAACASLIVWSERKGGVPLLPPPVGVRTRDPKEAT